MKLKQMQSVDDADQYDMFDSEEVPKEDKDMARFVKKGIKQESQDPQEWDVEEEI